MTIQDYLSLVTSQYQNSPNFLAMISQIGALPVQVQSVLNSFTTLFNLSTPPVGDQLQIIGQWVGISNQVDVPITGVFFTWDGTAATGWDAGSWQIPGATGIVTLPDSTYLNLINAKIAANSWDGTTEEFYEILSEAFPDYLILMLDHQNMSYSLGIIGNPVDSLTLALFTGGYIPVRPETIEVSDYFTNTNSGPLFGFDMDTSLVQGWDSGSWVTELT